MATPAAVLSILVKTEGAQASAAQIAALDKTAQRSSCGLLTIPISMTAWLVITA